MLKNRMIFYNFLCFSKLKYICMLLLFVVHCYSNMRTCYLEDGCRHFEQGLALFAHFFEFVLLPEQLAREGSGRGPRLVLQLLSDLDQLLLTMY
jgi:hypothetical protein